ncbi:MAG: carboxypeptidase-like regulatory domain-containing protein [Bryobacteraceae bacterium]
MAMTAVTPRATAQSASTGRVSGQVTDRQGAVVSGADVVLTNTATSSTLRTVTNEVGRYLILNVDPGKYDVTFSMAGFSQARLREQTVAVGLELTLNATLEVGSVTTAVEVQAMAGAELQTSNSTVGGTVSGVALMNLPNLGRDANAFLALQPAVTPSGQVAGVVQDQSQFQLDGGNNSDDQEGGHSYNLAPGNIGNGSTAVPTGVMPTPVETIEEFKVGISNQAADFNGAAGSQVQMVSKRGTNKFHGAAYDHYFAGNIGANTWQGNHTPSAGLKYTPLPSTHQNRFGASIGGPLTPAFWGGKTYFFFNYEGRRFPNVATYERPVPTPLMRAGVIQVANSAGQMTPYNLNAAPVTVNGVTYQPAVCPAGSCDPRGAGLNPIVSQIWNKYMPLPNDPNFGDRFNTQGFFTTLALPQNSNFAMARIDHDFGVNWRFTAGYRYYKFLQMTNQQVDIGGFLSGNTLGNAVATAPRRQTPSYWVAGLSGVLTPHLVNDFHFNFLRNAWEWISAGGPVQLPGLGGAALIGGSGGGQLIPIQVDRGSGLARYWDGMDTAFRDDLTWIKGNHSFQFGGQYQRNNIKHQRNDNGINIYNQAGYEITSGAGIVMPTGYIPSTVAANQIGSYSSLYAITLGMVAQTQLMYARKGGALLPAGSPIFSQNIIPNYNVYFGDTWRVRPTLTISYGLGYEIQMPVREVNGNVPMITDAQGNAFTGEDYLARRKAAALSGQVYNPTLGFATIKNVVGSPNYPYNPYYRGVGPRVSVAWNPKYTDGLLGMLLGVNKTVFRGGYSRRYGRINGINVIQVPLQGIGIGQTVQCTGVSRNGQCLGVAGVDPTNAFRIGVDGLVAPLPTVSQQLPQPFLPGVGGNASGATAWSDDPSLKPSHIDQVNFTIQREISSRIRLELGYIGTRSRDEQLAYSLDSVPYMTTLGGQAFSQAFANSYLALSSGQTPGAQPFFETALGGPSSAYCAGFANCTAALVSKQRSAFLTTSVYNLWAAMNAAPGWTLGRTMPSSNPIQVLALPQAASFGYSNYNGVFLSARVNDVHGLTASSNLTFSRSLGTGGYGSGIGVPVDLWNIGSMYGRQPFDINWIYNLSMYYQPKFLEKKRGVLGHIVGGWGFAPLFTAQSGVPLGVSSSSNCQSFGQANCSYLGGTEQAIAIGPVTGGNQAHYNIVSNGVAGQSGNPARGGSGINMFEDPSAVYSNFRRVILGVDSRVGGAGPLRGFPLWNLDMAVMKDIKVKEGIGATLIFQFVNVLNHFQPANPGLNIDSPASFGVVTSQATPPRQMEFGVRLFF